MYPGFRKMLFVCTGNTCRSPLAEAIARHIWKEEPHYMMDHPEIPAEVEFSSAGAGATRGHEYTRFSVEIAEYEYDEDISQETATPVSDRIMLQQDLVVCVTDDHSRYLRFKYPEMSDRIFSFKELLDDFYIPEIDGEVTDPFGHDYLVYQETAKQIERILRAVFPEILKKWRMT